MDGHKIVRRPGGPGLDQRIIESAGRDPEESDAHSVPASI